MNLGMKKIIISIGLIILVQSCTLFCHLDDKAAYEYVKDLNTSILKPSSYVYPTIEEINMKKEGRYYIFNDTMLRIYPLTKVDTLFEHFYFKIGCEYGKPYIKDGWIEQFE